MKTSNAGTGALTCWEGWSSVNILQRYASVTFLCKWEVKTFGMSTGTWITYTSYSVDKMATDYTLFTELNKASKSLLSLQGSFGPLTSSWPLTYLKGAAAAGVGTTRAAGAVLMTSSEKTANDTDGLFSVCLPAEASGGAAGLFSVCLPAQASGGAAGLFSVCLLAEASGGTAGLVFVAGMKALRLGSGSLNTLQTAQSKIGTWAPTYSPHIWL